MKLMITLFLISLNVLSATKIIGGQRSELKPFFVNLSTTQGIEGSFCGASLISESMAITAAHCLADQTGSVYLVHGESDNKTIIKAEKIILHESYGDGTLKHDIALIVFNLKDKKLSSRNMEKIKINDDPNYEHENLTAIGRGNMTSIGGLVLDYLSEVRLDYIGLEACKLLESEVDETQICAGFPQTGGRDTCQGDSGGPLVELINGEYVLVGLTSYGRGCAQKNHPGIYTRVASFNGWIKQKIQEYEQMGDVNNSEHIKFHLELTLFNLSLEPKVQLYESELLESRYIRKDIINRIDDLIRVTAISDDLISSEPLYVFSMNQQEFRLYLSEHELWLVADSGDIWKTTYEQKIDRIQHMCQFKQSEQIKVAMRFNMSGMNLVMLDNRVGLLVDVEQQGDEYQLIESCFTLDYRFEIYQDEQKDFFVSVDEIFYKVNFVTLGNDNGLSVKIVSEELFLENKSDEDLFSWQLKCNAPFSIDEGDYLKIKNFLYPTDIFSSLPAGEELKLNIKFDLSKLSEDDELECVVNEDFEVEINL